MTELFPSVMSNPSFLQKIDGNNSQDSTSHEIERGRNQWHYNFEKQNFIRDKDNKFKKVDKFLSIQKWIEKIVLTTANVWKIYDGSEYGSEFLNIIFSNFDDDFKVMLLNKECKRVFPLHPEINRVENIRIYLTTTNSCLITFTIFLLDDESFEGQLEI